jgi:dienelactone hydrolase
MPPVHIEDIAYDFDGTEMIGHLAYDDSHTGRRPAVLLSHEGPGLDDHVKGRAERLAGLGYVAFALDYHGGGIAMPIEQAMARLGVLMADPLLTRRLGLAGLDVLLAQDVADPDRVAAIGYCYGGVVSLEIGRSGADVKAIVGFHPGLTGPSADSKNIKGSVLMCIGTKDPFVPTEMRLGFEQDMAEAGVADWNIEVYGDIGHSFTNPAADDLGMPGIGFDARADARSWESMLRLFSETINA